MILKFPPTTLGAPHEDWSALSDAALLSLAHDGELPASATHAWQRLGQFTDSADAQSDWQTHSLIGSALRSQNLGQRGRQTRADWMSGFRERLDKESPHGVGAIGEFPQAPAAPLLSAAPATAAPATAVPVTTAPANDRFWKRVAGASGVFSVAALSFAVVVGAGKWGSSSDRSALAVAPSQARIVAVQVADSSDVFLRDARMVERMAQHRQLGAIGPHGSAAFVRNAVYDSSR